MNMLPVTIDTIKFSLGLFERYGYSFWDCNILSAAYLNDCSVVYSEDMQHGQIIDGKIKIINPFKKDTSIYCNFASLLGQNVRLLRISLREIAASGSLPSHNASSKL